MGKRGPEPGARPSRQAPVFSMRLHPDLRERLEDAAKKSGKSLADEISGRLDDSLSFGHRMEELFGGEQNAMLMRLAALPMQRKNNWLHDPDEFDACVEAINAILSQIRPPGGKSDLPRMLDKAFYGDLIWHVVKTADPNMSRPERTELDRLAINAQAVLKGLHDRVPPIISEKGDGNG